METLFEIQEDILRNAALPLRSSACQLVFGKGNPLARIVVIGEAPGKKEDEQGVPFVGAAGRELDRLLRLIGLSLEHVYIANILKYRPPDNRNPTREEIRTHTPYLVRQIEAIRPQILVPLGNFAAKFILAGMDTEKMTVVPGISGLHGVPSEICIDTCTYTVVPMYHPAAMLYNPRLREIVAADFIKLGQILCHAESRR